MKTKVLDTIKKYNMLERGDNVCVGFSGGADSTALLYLLSLIKDDFEIKVTAVHLNHMLRGEESMRDELFCTDFCRKHGIEFHCERSNIENVAQECKISIEEAARMARYSLFGSRFASKIATAHTLSDSVETILINITRGTGIDGLTGIPPVRGNIIRPLIECSRAEIESFCNENNLDFVTDSTNLEDVYTRNKIRLNVVPILKEINPSLEKTILSATEVLRSENDYLDGIAKESLQEIKQEHKYNRQKFLALNPVVARRVIIRILESHKVNVSRQRVEQIIADITAGKNGQQLSKDWFLEVRTDWFRIKNAKENCKREYFQFEVLKEDLIDCALLRVIPEKIVRVKRLECKEIENIAKSFPNRLKNLLDYDKIARVSIMRQRKAGDRFLEAGRNCTKSLKKLFNEAGLSPGERDNTIVFEQDGEVIWVEGFGASENIAVDATTTHVIELKTIAVDFGKNAII